MKNLWMWIDTKSRAFQRFDFFYPHPEKSAPLIIKWHAIYNSNWTPSDWNAIWSEIIRVVMISKLGERAARVRLIEITRFQLPLQTEPFWNRRIQSVPIFHWWSSWFVERREQKAFKSYFVFETEMMRHIAKIRCNFKQRWCDLEHKWRDLE